MKRLFPEFQFTWLVEETKKNLPLELDFLNEGKNSEKLQQKFSKLKFLKVFKAFVFQYWGQHVDRTNNLLLSIDSFFTSKVFLLSASNFF